ncbi:MAG: GNAT family N-acetyltransferase [Betaproteobacteria bacterium]|nr:GNAT family N-acetyltransferase [Betaproteobacteria bacterium]
MKNHPRLDIFISLPAQTLELFQSGILLKRYSVSTAKNGVGEKNGSYCTPRGRHIIRAKIGAGCPENAVFVRRRPTGEIWSEQLSAQFPGRDWILSRILWLSGCQPGFNRLGDVDTMRRYIYLHGSPDTVAMGVPGSIGCVRMRNRDIIELFDLVAPYTPLTLGEFNVKTESWEDAKADAVTIRETVFIREQGVSAEIELDEFDAPSLHALALDVSGRAIGTGRLLPDGHIGRMAVLPAWRKHGVGTALLRRLIEVASLRGMRHLALNAQEHAASFYSRFGFEPDGTQFFEAGIPHLRMSLNLSA